MGEWTACQLLTRLATARANLPRGQRPASKGLITPMPAASNGWVSVRAAHKGTELNDFLLQVGAHVGYAVRPAFRGRGYATGILELSLDVLREAGLDGALVTCDDDNVASARVITRCGGVLEDLRQENPDEVPKRRYWIDLT